MAINKKIRQGYNNKKTERVFSRSHDALVLYGSHTVKRLLQVYPLMTTSVMVREGLLEEMREFARNCGYRGPLHVAKEAELDKKTRGAIHQGVVAELPGFPYSPLDAITADTRLVLALDQIQDPQNMGALIRSAVAFGCGAVIIPVHEQVGVTGVVARASAGSLFDIPVVKVTNLSQALDALKKKGFWIAGLAGDAPMFIEQYAFDTPTVLVLGSEGDGIRQSVRDGCDVLLSIAMSDSVESLNVSVAGGIALSHAYNELIRGVK